MRGCSRRDALRIGGATVAAVGLTGCSALSSGDDASSGGTAGGDGASSSGTTGASDGSSGASGGDGGSSGGTFADDVWDPTKAGPSDHLEVSFRDLSGLPVVERPHETTPEFVDPARVRSIFGVLGHTRRAPSYVSMYEGDFEVEPVPPTLAERGFESYDRLEGVTLLKNDRRQFLYAISSELVCEVSIGADYALGVEELELAVEAQTADVSSFEDANEDVAAVVDRFDDPRRAGVLTKPADQTANPGYFVERRPQDYVAMGVQHRVPDDLLHRTYVVVYPSPDRVESGFFDNVEDSLPPVMHPDVNRTVTTSVDGRIVTVETARELVGTDTESA